MSAPVCGWASRGQGRDSSPRVVQWASGQRWPDPASLKHFSVLIFSFLSFFLNYNPLSLDSRSEFEPIAKSQWFIKFTTQLYLYKAWRTPLFPLVSWGRTESLEENQPPRGERRGPQQPVGQEEATSCEGEDPSDSSSNSQQVFCSFPTFHFNVPLQELGRQVQPLNSSVGQWTEIESLAVGTWHLWMKLCQAHPFSYHSQPQPWWPQPFSYHSQPSAMEKDVLFIVGDWNAKVGSQEISGVTGKFGLGAQNEAGQRLIEFCQENALVIANTLFQQHKRRLYIWT